jgi:hypothetical protein
MASTCRYIAKFGIKPSEKRVEFHVAMCTLYIRILDSVDQLFPYTHEQKLDSEIGETIFDVLCSTSHCECCGIWS